MPMIQTEGTHQGKVKSASIIEHRFEPEAKGAYEIKLDVEVDEGGETRHGTVFLPITSDNDYQDSSKKEAEVTVEKLAFLGVPDEGKNLGQLDVVVGRDVEIYVKENAKGYKNCYLNTGKSNKVADTDAAQKALSLFTSGETGGQAKPTFDQGSNEQAQSAENTEDDVPF